MSEWIKCSERLPKESECVLAICDNGHSQSNMNIISVIYENGKWHIDHFCEYSYADPEYWMPLPNPPESQK